MSCLEPAAAEELAGILLECASREESIEVAGAGSKRSMAGPIEPSVHRISTKRLSRVLMYEPRDLTISVEAGLPFSELQSLVAANGQMVALDPPFARQATVGGVVATNGNGPMRRAYGTARDVVIGMEFATLEGKLVQTGGMVVKNVAGLDMGKLMIGSFGTLAVMTSVNFRLHSLPERTETFLYSFPELDEAIERRNKIMRSVLDPLSIDLLSPAISLRLGHRGYMLAVRAAGIEPVLARYRRELGDAATLNGPGEDLFWKEIQEFSAEFLAREPDGIIARVSTNLQSLGQLPKTVPGSFITRGTAGVSYFYFPHWNAAAPWWQKARDQNIPGVIEHAPNDIRAMEELWSRPRSAAESQGFVMMKKVKQMFDPDNLLNRKRLYGCI